ncbi:methyltransferase domain-containing protein [Actinomadura sp. LD22]|uniref:Methyltransferase domain-containing protein n=1 Tax=Actinomadura physcomitrii TaxID=2650748 RepID=A0A6I4MT19_9ACTN|nr:class I SAM-dependent methyltransferase [Actinomadura physcomitrii]MWA07017.1 methyltransferase domain-containing protein [Actinomadura physcomitrii]
MNRPATGADLQWNRADRARSTVQAHNPTLLRCVRLLSAFRRERTDPDYFYELMAQDTIAQLRSYTSLEGVTAIDVETGFGEFARAMTAAGARCTGIDHDLKELTALGPPAANALVASALDLPFRTGSVDVCFSSNVLEHVSDPWRMADEMVRVTRPDGIVFLAFTNWLSPWGGHETSPWHYLGGERAARRYARRVGRPPKNLYGCSLHPVSVSAALAWARRNDEVEVLDAIPRYLPRPLDLQQRPRTTMASGLRRHHLEPQRQPLPRRPQRQHHPENPTANL